MTLVEILISVIISLMLLAALVGTLSVVGSAVNDSRGVIEMTDRMRACQQRLREDLQGHTAPVVPTLRQRMWKLAGIRR